ncbi:MAG TPA: M23 family metallopeptidase [Gemmatimonadaceae bacterium]|nr:M23 family metallopeptidase [Gemmatimonadaceae bacterium]
MHIRKLLLLLPFFGACSVGDAVRRLGGADDETAYDRYARGLRAAGLDSTALGREWLAASDSAIRAPLLVTLPLREAGFYNRSEARAVAHRFQLLDGQRIVATVRTAGLPAHLFIDLYEETSDTLRPFIHRATGDSAEAADSSVGPHVGLEYEARRSGSYVLRIQAELLRSGRYDLTLRAEPSLAFPVQGTGNRAVLSFFGAERDGGRRSHHGIDIFAARGTPVLAASDGLVRSTRSNELGGNVVWLRDDARGHTLYYAHLDRHAVSAGQPVRAGDTIGFVGNTGNARTTRPHLHFGIYRRGEGPIDPYPFVRLVTAQPAALAADTSKLGSLGIISARRTPLLITPGATGDTVRSLAPNTAVQIVGAAGRWYRVQLEDGVAGYVAARAISARRPPVNVAATSRASSATAIPSGSSSSR